MIEFKENYFNIIKIIIEIDPIQMTFWFDS